MHLPEEDMYYKWLRYSSLQLFHYNQELVRAPELYGVDKILVLVLDEYWLKKRFVRYIKIERIENNEITGKMS